MIRSLSLLALLGLFASGIAAQKSADESWLQIGLNVFLPHSDQNIKGFIAESSGFQTQFSYQERAGISLHAGFLRIRENGWLLNLALTDLRFDEFTNPILETLDSQGIPIPIGGQELTRMIFRTRIAYGKVFSMNKQVRMSLSVGIDPNFQYYRSVPTTSAGFPNRMQSIGFTMRAIPGLTIPLNSRLKLNVQLALGFYDMDLRYFRIDNPILREEERKSREVNDQLGFYDFQGTLGLNFRL